MAANDRKRAMHNGQYWILKALANEDTYCSGHIDAYDVSWARKSAGHKMNVVFPCCANWETFGADTKCF